MHAAIDDARVMLASFLCLRGASLVLLSRGPIVRRGLPARGMPGIDVVVCVGDLRDGDLHVVMGGNVREARAECLDEIVVFIGEALLVCVVLDGASGHEALHETTQVHVEPHAHTSANHVSGELLEPLCGTLDFAEELVGVKDCDGLDHVPEGHVLDEILVERAQAVSVEQACEGAVYLGRSFAGDEFLERNERDSIGVRIVRADDRCRG